MREKEPMIVRGDDLIEVLNLVSSKTLDMIRSDLGEETFLNCHLVKIVDKLILARKKREVMEHLETLSSESPDFWD